MAAAPPAPLGGHGWGIPPPPVAGFFGPGNIQNFVLVKVFPTADLQALVVPSVPLTYLPNFQQSWPEYCDYELADAADPTRRIRHRTPTEAERRQPTHAQMHYHRHFVNPKLACQLLQIAHDFVSHLAPPAWFFELPQYKTQKRYFKASSTNFFILIIHIYAAGAYNPGIPSERPSLLAMYLGGDHNQKQRLYEFAETCIYHFGNLYPDGPNATRHQLDREIIWTRKIKTAKDFFMNRLPCGLFDLPFCLLSQAAPKTYHVQGLFYNHWRCLDRIYSFTRDNYNYFNQEFLFLSPNAMTDYWNCQQRIIYPTMTFFVSPRAPTVQTFQLRVPPDVWRQGGYTHARSLPLTRSCWARDKHYEQYRYTNGEFRTKKHELLDPCATDAARTDAMNDIVFHRLFGTSTINSRHVAYCGSCMKRVIYLYTNELLADGDLDQNRFPPFNIGGLEQLIEDLCEEEICRSLDADENQARANGLGTGRVQYY